MRCLWRDSIYQLWAEGLICYLVPTVTSVLLWVLSLCFHFSFVFQLLIYIRLRVQKKERKIIQTEYLTLLLAAKQSDRGVNTWAVGQCRCSVSRCVLPVLCVPNPASEQSNLSVFEKKKRSKKRKQNPVDAAQENILTSGIANLCRSGSSSS